jgi:hypothetical protein
MRRGLGLLTLAVALVAACKGPVVQSPLNGQTRYLCCNMHYEKPEISDVNYLKGTLIPFGTRVQILEVRKNSVKFQPAGHPPIELILKYGKDQLSMDQYLDRIFLVDDPHTRLRPAPAPVAKGKKGAKGAPREAAGGDKVEKLIEQGVPEVGMTRAQVLMAIGYPPAHRTPSIDGPVWTYWQNRWATMEVVFDGDRVARINR